MPIYHTQSIFEELQCVPHSELDSSGRRAMSWTHRAGPQHTGGSFGLCPLVWMGAAATHLSQLDRVQHRALTLIGTGAAMDTLSLQRRVAGLTTLYKLHYITSPALAATRPAIAIAPAIAPATRRRSAANLAHELQLQTALPARSCNVVLRSFPECLIEAWNELPATLLRDAPSAKGMQ